MKVSEKITARAHEISSKLQDQLRGESGGHPELEDYLSSRQSQFFVGASVAAILEYLDEQEEKNK